MTIGDGARGPFIAWRAPAFVAALALASCMGGAADRVEQAGDNASFTPPVSERPRVPGPTTPGGTTPDPTVPNEPDPRFPVGANPAGSAEQCEVDQLSSPEVYGNKVKTLLTGSALTREELQSLKDRPEGFSELIDVWLASPDFERVLAQFFKTAFQQNQLDPDGISQMLRRNNTNWGRFENPREELIDLLRSNFRESFARTAVRMVREGRPFNQVITTDTYEMTTAMLVFQAFLEQRYVNDRNQVRQVAMPEVTTFTVYRNRADAPSAAAALDPSNPRFLHFYVPTFRDLCLPADQTTYEVGEAAFSGNDELFFIFSMLIGRPDRVFNREANRTRGGNPCRSGNGRIPPLLTRGDFEDWRTVRLRPAARDEEPTRFYRLDLLRQANELPVRSERIGFFTTPGFFATWPTNEDNASRVSINQTLITALGKSFDGNTVSDFSPPDLDEEHSAPGTACYGCHQTLDPMRDFFRHSYSAHYGLQDDSTRMQAMNPQFVFRGVRGTGAGVRDLANILLTHPDFSPGWVQKMCYFANSAPCPEADPAFKAVAETFIASNYNFTTMLKALLSSELVTNADCVEGGTGYIRSISRRDQLCAQLSTRLGVEDICGLGVATAARRSRTQREVASAVVSIPQDTFARGEPDPVVISQTGLFTRATREVLCTVVAERAYAEAFGDADRESVLDALVNEVMGLPQGDARHDDARRILAEHVRDGMSTGASEQVALQSALVVACMSPGVAGIGF